MNTKELFLTTPPRRLFFIAALPGAISMLASALYSFFDGVFVGQFLGDRAFAAINLAIPFVILNFALSDLIAVGSSVPISIKLGQKKDKEADEIFSTAVLLILMTGIAMGAFLYFGSPYLLTLLGAEGELCELAVSYIRVYAIFSPFTTLTFAVDNYLKISGKIKYSMFLNILLSAMTVLLEFLFLFVFKFSIVGAALASCLSMVVMILFAFAPFLFRKLQLTFTQPRFSKAILIQILSCGTPVFLSNIAGRITSIAMNAALLATGGENAVATWGILMYVGELVQPIVYGICDALSPAIGYNWGAGYTDRVKAFAKYIYLASATVSCLAGVLMLIIPGPLASLFTKNTDPLFLAEVNRALRIYALSRFTTWFAFATQIYLTAVDKPVFATLLSIFSSLIFPLTLIALLYPLGLFGLWLNPTVAAFLTAALALFLFGRFSKELKRKSL